MFVPMLTSFYTYAGQGVEGGKFARGPIFFRFFNEFLMKICVRNVLNFSNMRFRWILRRKTGKIMCRGVSGVRGSPRVPLRQKSNFLFRQKF